MKQPNNKKHSTPNEHRPTKNHRAKETDEILPPSKGRMVKILNN
jgi:hypothetical protein